MNSVVVLQYLANQGTERILCDLNVYSSLENSLPIIPVLRKKKNFTFALLFQNECTRNPLKSKI
jgi:hypothetical protein